MINYAMRRALLAGTMRAGGAVPDLLTDLRWFYDLDEASGNALADYGSGGDWSANGSPGQAAGPVGFARSLNGTSQYFASSGAGTISQFTLISDQPFTLSLWIYATSFAGNRDIIGVGNGASWSSPLNLAWGLRLLNASGVLRFACNHEGSILNIDSASGISQNAWHHILVYSSGYSLTVSVDGTNVANVLHGALVRNSGLITMYIGAVQTYFSGRITRIGFWDRAIASNSIEGIALASYAYKYAELT